MPEKPTYEDLEKRIQKLQKAEHEREQTAFELQRRLEFEKLVKEISSEFAGVVGSNSIDLAINRALSSVGTFTGADRAYIFSFKDVAAMADNTHEWCAKDIKPQIDTLQDIPIDEELPWFTKHIRNHEVFHIPKVAALPHEAVLERKHFEAQNIQSLIVVPMETTERLIGFLGFDAVTKPRNWGEDDKAILQFFAQTLSHVIERKMVQDALRDSETFLKTLINAIPSPIFYKGEDGKYLGFNTAFETFFGETKDRLIGKSVFDINPPELAEIYRTQDDELFNSGGVQCYESQWKNANGQLRDFIFNKAAFTDNKGNVAGLIGVLIDITERKQAEEALLESEKKFSALFQASPVYIAFTALDDGCFLDVNNAFTKITGYERNEVLGRTPTEIGLWFIPEERIKFIKLAQQHGGFHEEEVKFRRKNGDAFYGIWSAEKIESGDKTCLISVLVDVTERRKTQEALRQERDKLRAAISEIKTLSGLVPICSNCKMIRDDQGYWNQIEKYIGEHSDAQFSHGICPECAKKLYPDFELYDDEGKLI